MMKSVVRALVAVSLIAWFPARADANRFGHYTDGTNHWIVGCVPDEQAARLVAHAGFEYGNAGAPVLILCVEGYQMIGKELSSDR